MSLVWFKENTTIYWHKAGDIHLFVFRLPVGRPFELWRWSAWRGDNELYMSQLSYDTREKAKKAARSYADERMYCA